MSFRIGFLVTTGMIGLLIVILSFSEIVTQIFNNTFSFKSLMLFIPMAIGLFISFLSSNYLHQNEFASQDTSEKKK